MRFMTYVNTILSNTPYLILRIQHKDHSYSYVKEAATRERHVLMNAQPALLNKHKALIEFQKGCTEIFVVFHIHYLI